MSSYILEGEPPVEVLLRRSARAKRLSLRVSQLDGRVTLTMPRFASAAEAHDFIHEKAVWLRQHVSRFEEDILIAEGAEIPLQGELIRIAAGQGRKILAQDGALFVPGPSERMGARLQAYLKEIARAELTAASDRYAAQLGRKFSKITLRDTRSRWGSCSSQGALMYSWRLVLAPRQVLEYVAAHEVAHLEEMNHSRAFWRVVERLYGSHDTPRRWLREHGSKLHKYRF